MGRKQQQRQQQQRPRPRHAGACAWGWWWWGEALTRDGRARLGATLDTLLTGGVLSTTTGKSREVFQPARSTTAMLHRYSPSCTVYLHGAQQQYSSSTARSTCHTMVQWCRQAVPPSVAKRTRKNGLAGGATSGRRSARALRSCRRPSPHTHTHTHTHAHMHARTHPHARTHTHAHARAYARTGGSCQRSAAFTVCAPSASGRPASHFAGCGQGVTQLETESGAGNSAFPGARLAGSESLRELKRMEQLTFATPAGRSRMPGRGRQAAAAACVRASTAGREL